MLLLLCCLIFKGEEVFGNGIDKYFIYFLGRFLLNDNSLSDCNESYDIGTDLTSAMVSTFFDCHESSTINH